MLKASDCNQSENERSFGQVLKRGIERCLEDVHE